MLKSTALLATFLIVSSCSKSPLGGSTVTDGTTIDAQFIDDPVKGLSFVAASGTGKTGSQGKFKCTKGEKLAFKIAGLEIGEAICGEKIFVDDLVSDEPGHSPEKVAAIIQSFAVAGSDELDLSTAVDAMDEEALSALSFAGDNDTFTAALADRVSVIKIAVPELLEVIDAKDTNDMRTILDRAIAIYSSLSNAFKALLATLASDPDTAYEDLSSDKVTIITGTLIPSSYSEKCYGFVQARLSVKQEADGQPYKLAVDRLAVFNSLEDYNVETNRCAPGAADGIVACDDDTVAMILPAPKLITSETINLLVSGNDDYMSWENKTLLKASLVNGSLKISGSFEENWTWPDYETGEKTTGQCKYTLTSEEVDIPDEGDLLPDEEPTGSFAGQLTCYDYSDIENPISAGNMTAAITIIADNTAPEGYKASTLSFTKDSTTVSLTNQNLVNDIETPDDTPFLSFNHTENSKDYTILGYNETGGYFMSIYDGPIQCEGIIPAQ